MVDPYICANWCSIWVSQNGVQLGQPVMTHEDCSDKLPMCKINTAEVTLITDTKVNVPVMVQRNPSVRGFISGDKSEGFWSWDFLTRVRICKRRSVGHLRFGWFVSGQYSGGESSEYRAGRPDGRSELTVVPLVHALSVR